MRIAPSSLRSHIKRGTMVERTVDPSHAKAAADLFRTDSMRSFGVNLGDLADEPWSLLPADSDFLAEIHTKRFGVLTYTRSLHQAEDISLFNRAAQRQISLYASGEKIETRGMFYDEDDSLECDVQHYEIDASLDPRLQAYFFFFRARGARKFGRLNEDALFQEAYDYAASHQLNQIAHEIETERKKIPAASRESSELFEPSPELRRVAEALGHLRESVSS